MQRKELRSSRESRPGMHMRPRALILSCSERKRRVHRPSPAIEVYDGPYYRIIRKLMREGRFATTVDIFIISAMYGLLRSKDLITPYERRINAILAKAMRADVLASLQRAFSEHNYREVFINLGADYRLCVSGLREILAPDASVLYARGGIGQRGSQMKAWLLEVLDRDDGRLSAGV